MLTLIYLYIRYKNLNLTLAGKQVHLHFGVQDL